MEYYKQSIGDVVKEFNSNAKDGLHADIIPFSITCIFLIVYIPVFNLYFHTSPFHATDWILPFASWAICLTIYEVRKWMKNRKELSPQ